MHFFFLSKEIIGTHEPVAKGTDVKPFYLGKPAQYLLFDQEKFQQTAPEWKYRAKEKLVYRFISKRLVFAYDDKQSLTLNSANILIPNLDNIPINLDKWKARIPVSSFSKSR